MHQAKQAFISSESSEKIRRALKNNIRKSGDTKYITVGNVSRKKINENAAGIPERYYVNMGNIFQ